MAKGTLLKNGNIYTMEPGKPLAGSILLQDGKVQAVSDDKSGSDLRDYAGEQVDLDGRCVTPGLVDAHVHFQVFSIYRQYVNLDEASSLEEVLGRIEQFVARQQSHSPTWIKGRGWSQNAWENKDFPMAAHLDRIIPDRPAVFVHKSGHASWVNSQALKLAGITTGTPDPPGGQIHRDEGGNATGILFEDAMKLVSALIPDPTIDEITMAMVEGQKYCWQVGLTGVNDFDGRSCFQALQTLHERGELGLHVVKNIPASRVEYAVGVGLRSGFGDRWLRIGGIKIFADGALGPQTALMVDPYEGNPQNYGIAVTDKEEMMAIAELASAHDLSLTVHAIGDRANHDVLDVFEAVRKQELQRGVGRKLRHRIEHVQVLHPNDLDRLAQLDVIASMQPLHATSDMLMADRFWGARARYSYAWRTMLNSGATLVFGSDAPVEIIDPLPGIHASVTRQRADGSPGPDGWYPEERLTMAETIHAYTMGAAFTSGQEHVFGSITPGKFADLTIYDRDIFAVPGDELLDVKIAGTVVNGQFKFRAW